MKDLAKLIIFVLLISVGLIFVFRHETPDANDPFNMAQTDPVRDAINLITPAPPVSGNVTVDPTPIYSGPQQPTPPVAPPVHQTPIVVPPPVNPQPPQDVIYTVQAKDNLYKIAEKTLGKKSEWKKIFEYNKDVLTKPEALKLGMKLRIPQPQKDPSLGTGADLKSGVDTDKKLDSGLDTPKTPGLVEQPTTTDTQKMKTYEVVKGDTLAKIAKKLYKDSSKKNLIKKANPGLTDETLRYGVKINVPNE